LEVAPGDAYEACIVAIIRQRGGIRLECVEEAAERRIDRALVGEPAKRRALARTRRRALSRHVGGLVPGEHRAGGEKIADLQQAVLELGEIQFERRAALRTLPIAPGHFGRACAGYGLACCGAHGDRCGWRVEGSRS